MEKTLLGFINETKPFWVAAISGTLFYIISYYKCLQDKDCEARLYLGLLVTKFLASGFVGWIVNPMLDPTSDMYAFYLASIGAGSFKVLEVMGTKAETLIKGK